MYPPAFKDACTLQTWAGERRTTCNGKRNNTSRIIVKREKTAVIYIIPHRLRILLLAVNSPRFLRSPLRSIYLHIVSVVQGSYSPRCVYTYSTAREICRVQPRDGNGDPCAQRGDKAISSGFVTPEDHDHASRTRR